MGFDSKGEDLRRKKMCKEQMGIQESQKEIEAIEESVHSKNIKGYGSFTFRKGKNVGGADVAFFLPDNSGEPSKLHQVTNKPILMQD
jgi:hypothetical protein